MDQIHEMTDMKDFDRPKAFMILKLALCSQKLLTLKIQVLQRRTAKIQLYVQYSPTFNNGG